MQNPLIHARNLCRHYHRGSETVKAIDGIDLDIMPGTMVSILGPSGSGKTTLVNLLSCLDAPTAGTLTINGTDVDAMTEDKLAAIRRGLIGFVFQKFYLIPTLTVAENVELPLLFFKRAITRECTQAILHQVGLEDRANHLPAELSGGQMQRVAIARALVVQPRILMADEPTGNLDSENGAAIFNLLRRLVQDQRLTVILTTHNLVLGNQADRIITLKDGRIINDILKPVPPVPST